MIYFDSSALVKLVRVEKESADLVAWLRGQPPVKALSSSLARVEVVRAVANDGDDVVLRARRSFAELGFIQMTYGLLDAAASLRVALRSLDAIHLASAMRMGGALRAFVAYDKRLLSAAEQLGLPVLAPGAS